MLPIHQLFYQPVIKNKKIDDKSRFFFKGVLLEHKQLEKAKYAPWENPSDPKSLCKTFNLHL